MSGFEKLDSFFDPKRIKKHRDISVSKRGKMLRVVKITLPALSSMLIGLLVLWPTIKDKASDVEVDTKSPSLEDFEKLHMENTTFYMTDKNNKVNSIVSDVIDEVDSTQKLLELTNPKGFLPTSDDKTVVISSPKGFYNQHTKVLTLNEGVKMVYGVGVTALTNNVTFDSLSAKVFSVDEVTATGYFGDLQSEGFEYYKDDKYIIFNGKSHTILKQDDVEKLKIDASKELFVYQTEKKVEAIGDAQAYDNEKKVLADKLVAFFDTAVSGKNELREFFAIGQAKMLQANSKLNADNIHYNSIANQAVATGNVMAFDGKNKVFSDRMEAFFEADQQGVNKIVRIEIPQNVKIVTDNGVVTAKTGIYYPDEQLVKLFDNVKIVQKKNVLHGQRAETDLKTGITRVLSGGKSRVSGVFEPEE